MACPALSLMRAMKHLDRAQERLNGELFREAGVDMTEVIQETEKLKELIKKDLAGRAWWERFLAWCAYQVTNLFEKPSE